MLLQNHFYCIVLKKDGNFYIRSDLVIVNLDFAKRTSNNTLYAYNFVAVAATIRRDYEP